MSVLTYPRFFFILQCFFLACQAHGRALDESIPPGEKLLKGEWSLKIQHGGYPYIRMMMVLTVGYLSETQFCLIALSYSIAC